MLKKIALLSVCFLGISTGAGHAQVRDPVLDLRPMIIQVEPFAIRQKEGDPLPPKYPVICYYEIKRGAMQCFDKRVFGNPDQYKQQGK